MGKNCTVGRGPAGGPDSFAIGVPQAQEGLGGGLALLLRLRRPDSKAIAATREQVACHPKAHGAPAPWVASGGNRTRRRSTRYRTGAGP